MEVYRKLNSELIEINYDNDGEPYFEYDGTCHYLDYFTRCHNNPWISDDYPEYIHAFDSTNYVQPLYIELLNDSELNVYERGNA